MLTVMYANRYQQMIDQRFYRRCEPATVVDYSVVDNSIVLQLEFVDKPCRFDYTIAFKGFVPQVGAVVKYNRFRNSI